MNDNPLSPFLVDVARLRQNASMTDSVWQVRWRQFCEQASVAAKPDRESRWPLHAAVVWLATGDSSWASRGAAQLLALLGGQYQRMLESGHPDTDTWMHAAPMARRAIALDWLWDSGTFTQAQRDELAELFICDALRYAYVVLHCRVPAHANNQGMAMALNLVVVGYLFGHRRGDDPRGRLIFREGLVHLMQQIALLPPGGFGSEGSTYAAGIEAPLGALACATLEAITNESWFDRKIAPWGNTFGSQVEHGSHFLSPSGLLFPWDQYGYQRCFGAAPEAYLAMRLNDVNRYRRVTHGNGWRQSGNGPWMTDDHAWQWIWMPLPPPPPDVREGEGREATEHLLAHAWCEPHTGAALVSRSQQFHLLQMWSWSSAPPTRCHMHPNNIVVEAFGSPLLVDGHAHSTFSLAPELAKHVSSNSIMARYDTSWWAQGSIAAHSCIMLDDARAMVMPYTHVSHHEDAQTTGQLLMHEPEADPPRLAGEVARFYQHTFADVHSVRRTCTLIADQLFAVCDQVDADKSHDVLSQFVLRSGAEVTEYGVRLRTAEHVVLDLIALGESENSLHEYTGQPSVMEQRCHHYRRRRQGATVELVTLLLPRLGRRLLADLTDDLSMTIRNDQDVVLADNLRIMIDQIYDHLPVTQPWCYTVDVTTQGSIAHVHDDADLLLELPHVYGVSLEVNGHAIDVPRLAEHHHGEPALLPIFVSLPRDLVRAAEGELTIKVTLRDFRHWGIHGRLRLHERIDVDVPVVDQTGEDAWRVAWDDQSACINLADLRSPAQPLRRPQVTGEDAAELAASVHNAVQQHDAPAASWIKPDTSAERGASVCRADANDSQPILTALLDDDWQVRMLAAKCAGLCGIEAAMPALREMLSHPLVMDTAAQHNLREQVMAAWALGKLKDGDAVPRLAELLDVQNYYGLRRVAAQALSRIATPQALDVLQHVAEDQDQEVAEAALRALRAG